MWDRETGEEKTLTDDVGSLLGHTDQLSARSVREFDSVDDTVGADNVRDVGDGRARGGTEIEDLGSGFDLRVVCCQPKRIL